MRIMISELEPELELPTCAHDVSSNPSSTTSLPGIEIDTENIPQFKCNHCPKIFKRRDHPTRHMKKTEWPDGEVQ